jgi:hypothetical protein
MTSPGWIDLDERACASAFSRSGLLLRHRLTGHPLLSLEAIAELADSIPPRDVERNPARLPLVLPAGGAERGDGVPAPGDIVRTINDNGSWLVLWNIEQHPDYGRLLDECLDPIVRLVPPDDGGMCRREAFLFISSADSLTPVHSDPEHNFLLQIRGTKRLSIGRFRNAGDHQAEIERYYAGGHRNFSAMPDDAVEFPLEPGTGVYVPTHAPHWVKNGAEPSVSLSITFHTPRIVRNGQVHKFNAFVRQRGLHPRPPGESAASDRVKAALVTVRRAVRYRTRT